MPLGAASRVLASQLRLGNSMHNPTNSWSSSDQVIRYVYRSLLRLILGLQFIDCRQHLLYLISLSHSFVVLNIDSRVSRPGCLINPVTAPTLSWRSKVIITGSEQIAEPHILGFGSYFP